MLISTFTKSNVFGNINKGELTFNNNQQTDGFLLTNINKNCNKCITYC